jgi:hypothetical protein
MLDQVLPCTGYVDARCVAELVRGGCYPAAAAAITAALGLVVVRAAAELMSREDTHKGCPKADDGSRKVDSIAGVHVIIIK